MEKEICSYLEEEEKKDEEEYIQAVKYRICRLWFFVFMRSGDHILVYLSYKLCI